MDEKETQRVTIDDLARMMNENFATKGELKAEIDRLETNVLAAIGNLPTRAEIMHLLDLEGRVAKLEAQVNASR